MITGKDMIEWGLSGKAIKVALGVFVPQIQYSSAQDVEKTCKAIVNDPDKFSADKLYGELANMIISQRPPKDSMTQLMKNPCPTTIFGESLIATNAISQIHDSSKLPISVQAALVPDAHMGYGLPIGGVLATRNSIIPWAVGNDIACRMRMTIFDIPSVEVSDMTNHLAEILTNNMVFGTGIDIDIKIQHPVLDDEGFSLPMIKSLNLRDLACRQIGTSGSGNHFGSFGLINIEGLDSPKLAFLTHSGSRGVGYKIADVYSALAMKTHKLPQGYERLAWLDMDSDAGLEYWKAMTLAGEFARVSHEIIHERIRKALKCQVVQIFENHHNFAWKEIVNGEELIVHRKGATPAGLGVKGIIPGSMSTSTFVVNGKGNPLSICSSSHGAGRAMSRNATKEKFTMEQMRENLKAAGVTLVGGSLDECSMGYKDIHAVMDAQKDLVEIIGEFTPKVVRMCGENKKAWDKSEGE